jgi:hypothetical protein
VNTLCERDFVGFTSGSNLSTLDPSGYAGYLLLTDHPKNKAKVKLARLYEKQRKGHGVRIHFAGAQNQVQTILRVIPK